EVPASVQTTLLAFLAQIRDDRTVFARRHDWSGQLYGGLTWDSNVNYGADDVIDIGGTPFLSDEDEDVGAVIDVGLLHTFNPNRTFEHDEQTGYFLWQTQGNAYYRSYFDVTESNLGVLTLRTGPAWVVPEDWRFTIGLQADQLFYGTENLALFTSIRPQFTKQLTDVSGYTVSVTAQERSYDDVENEPRDGRYYRAAFSYDRLLGNRVGSQIGVAWSDFDADGDQFSYDGYEIFAGLTYEAWQRGQVFGRIGYRQFDFEQPDPLVDPGVFRDDDEWRAIVGFRHELASTVAKGWTVRGDVIYTDNQSNVALYDYDRWQVNLGLQKSW
ncbi:MAG: DUF2860 family protein, partial [Gammaproteobacteria bacterium]|nr:DUF2860 family protein [Gammaproteobacteria bacterium]